MASEERGTTWFLGRSGAVSPLTKRPAETRLYTLHLGELIELRYGAQAIVGTPTVTATSQQLISGSTGVSVGTPQIVKGNRVQVNFGSGSDLEDYLISVTVTLSGGTTVRDTAMLKVRLK